LTQFLFAVSGAAGDSREQIDDTPHPSPLEQEHRLIEILAVELPAETKLLFFGGGGRRKLLLSRDISICTDFSD
jgi:hypothetical protein